MSGTPAILVELLNLPEGAEQGWRDWYDRAVLAERMALSGVTSAVRGVGVEGSYKEMAVFNVEDAAVLTSPDWQAANRRVEERDGASPEYQLYRQNLLATPYGQIYSTVERYRPIGAEAIHAAFFEVRPENHDEFNDWYNTEHLPPLMQVPGYLNGRRFQGLEDRNKFLALYETTELEVITGDAAMAVFHSPWSTRVRSKLATYRERRLFRVARVAVTGEPVAARA